MSKIISKEEVEKIAKLASLTLTEEETKQFSGQLSEVIDYNFELLKEVETKNIEPITNITLLSDVLREDETEPGLTQGEALKNTKEKHNGFFKVKAILE